MEIKKSLRYRRTGIIINYMSLAGFLICYELFTRDPGNKVLLTISLISLLLVITTFVTAYWRTGLWQITHASKSNLDEREVQLVLNSLRYSYAIFSIAVIVIFYFFSFTGLKISIVLAAGFIYLAHILPASVTGWFLKTEIDSD